MEKKKPKKPHLDNNWEKYYYENKGKNSKIKRDPEVKKDPRNHRKKKGGRRSKYGPS